MLGSLGLWLLSNAMNKTVYCIKLNQEAEQLDAPPFPGELGEKIYKNVSKKAWEMWLAQQTILINEYRLNLIVPESREFLLKEMQKYFFSDSPN